MAQANLIPHDAHTGWKDPTREQILDRAKLAGVVIDPASEVKHVETAISLVASGAGDSLVSRSIIDTPSVPLNVRTFKFTPPLYDTIALAQRIGTSISPATKKLRVIHLTATRRWGSFETLRGAPWPVLGRLVQAAGFGTWAPYARRFDRLRLVDGRSARVRPRT